MARDGVAAAPFDVAQHALEPLVGEDLDLAAVVADDVMVVPLGVADGLEAHDAVPEVEALDEAFLGEHVEDAVDAGEANGRAERLQLAVNLLGSDAAPLPVEEVDHSASRDPTPIAGQSQLGVRTLGPGCSHAKMVTVLDTADENRYRLVVLRIVPVSAAAVLIVAGCGPYAGAKGKETVVAAFYPLAFVAERLGGTKVQVENLTPPGAEPHDIELTPGDVARIQKADVVLYLSHRFQPAVEQAVSSARGKRIDVLAGIALRKGVGEDTGKADPHVWLDPVLFARVVRRIGAALGHPARANALAGRLLALDREYRSRLVHCVRRDFVTSHAAFGYLAARYHLHQIAVTGIDPESEPSPQRLRSLIDLIRRERVTTVFFERLVSPKLAQTVARDADAETAVLDPIEGLTPSEQARGDNYLSLMRQNLSQLRSALGCR